MNQEGRNYFTLADKVYREYVYQGQEFENKSCNDPREERKTYDVGGTGQLYYMRGYDQANYACDRFLTGGDTGNKKALKRAYDCCVKTSEDFVCINNRKNAKFCQAPNRNIRSYSNFLKKFSYIESLASNIWNDTSHSLIGNKCHLDGIDYQVLRGQNDPNKICVRTWSLCPYNFNIGGGTELIEYYKTSYVINEETGEAEAKGKCIDENTQLTKSCFNQPKNFCQLNRHCTIVTPWFDFIRDDKSISPYLDKACLNWIGSSHNTQDFKRYLGMKFLKGGQGSYKSFTAPLAECFNESMKNFLFNKAGHTQCKNTQLDPDENDECEDGLYLYRKGQNFNETSYDPSISMSSTIKLQKNIRGIVRVLIILAITIFGVKTVMTFGTLKKKVLLNLLIKVTLVWTFAYSPWWYGQVFKFVYGVSNAFSSIVMNLVENVEYGNTQRDFGLDVPESNIKSDGCYFGYDPLFDNNYKAYGDRTYLAIFDMLDCKITKYIGYNLANVPSMILMLIGPIFFLEVGLFLVILFLLFLFISFALKAVYILILSFVALAVMLFISPIMIPMVLFERTKGLFDSWLRNIISFALQPMVLFAYVIFSMSLLDKYVYGEALFIGKSPKKIMMCSKYCRAPETGEIVKIYGNVNDNTIECTEVGNEVVDISSKSFLCSLEKVSRTLGMKRLSFFNMVNIPLFDFISFMIVGNFILLLKIIFLIFILNKIMDRVPNVASNLTGGKTLPGLEGVYGVGGLATRAWQIANLTKSLVVGNIDRIGKIISKIPSRRARPSKGAKKAEKTGEGFERRP